MNWRQLKIDFSEVWTATHAEMGLTTYRTGSPDAWFWCVAVGMNDPTLIINAGVSATKEEAFSMAESAAQQGCG